MRGRAQGLAVVGCALAIGTGAAPALATTPTCTWTGGNADWNTAADWSCANTADTIPTSSDDVVIGDFADPDVATVNANARSISESSLGTVTIETGRSLTISSSGSTSLAGHVNVNGTGVLTLGDPTTWPSGVQISDSGTIDVNSSLSIPAAATVGGSGVVKVGTSGSITTDPGSVGTVTFVPQLDNDGTCLTCAVTASSGKLELQTGDAGSTTGVYSVSAGATLQVDTGTFEAPTVSGSGTVSVSGSSHLTVGSNDTFTPGALTIGGGGAPTATLNKDVSVATFTTGTGNRDGSGTLTVTGTADFALGDFTLGGGTTVVAGTVTSSTIAGTQVALTGATLTLDAPTTNATNTTIQLGGSPSTLNIDSSYDITGANAPITGSSSSVVNVGPLGSMTADPGATHETDIFVPVSNEGTVTVQSGKLAVFDLATGFAQSGGTTTVVSGAELDGAVTLTGGTLMGNGTLGGPVFNTGGTVAPGASPGTLTVTGAYTQGAAGTLAEEVTGTTPGTQFDQLHVGGAVTLDGTLAINSASFTPALSDTFKIISGASSRNGQFATVTGATVNGRTYSAQYDIDGVTLLAANAPAQTLSVAFAGAGAGSVSDGASLSCTAGCQHQYPQGAVVTLTATPASGSAFAGWSGAGCSGTGTCQVTMSAAQNVTATFNSIPPTTHTLTVAKAGTGSGTVTSSPAGISCGAACSSAYNEGTSVTLTATAASGSTFIGWSGACSGTGSCTVSLAQDRSVTATFDLLPVLVTPPVVSAAGLFCGAQHRGRCNGLKLKTTFSGPGNAVWQFAAYNPAPGHASSAVARVVGLGAIKRKITGAGTQTIVFKLAPGARTRKLYRQVVKLKLKSIRVTLTFTDAAGRSHVTVRRIRLEL